MDIKVIFEQGVGAVAGGAIVAAINWVAINSRVGTLETKMEQVSKQVEVCQSDRELCRKSMREHHESVDIHVGGALMHMLQDIQSRLERIETKLMNGVCKVR